MMHDTEVAERALGAELAKIKPWDGKSSDRGTRCDPKGDQPSAGAGAICSGARRLLRPAHEACELDVEGEASCGVRARVFADERGLISYGVNYVP